MYDTIIITLTIIIICVRCDHYDDNHHHLCTMRSSSRWRSSLFVYDAMIMMAIIIIRVRCDHHHSCTMRSSSFVYDAIIIICVRCDHHHSCTMRSSSWCAMHPCYGVSLWWMGAWVTRPERPKGVKAEVKQARRAQSRPEGPPARSRAPEGP